MEANPFDSRIIVIHSQTSHLGQSLSMESNCHVYLETIQQNLHTLY